MSEPLITFRPLTLADLPRLHEWLSRPHVAEWWAPTPTPAELEEEYGPAAIEGSGTQPYVVLANETPVGFIQSYVAVGSGEGWWPDEQDPGVRGIDQFLAHRAQLDQGLGTRVVRDFVERLFEDPAVTRIQTDPSPANGRAIRCYQKAGFRAVREIDTPDGPALFMVCDRV